MQFTATIEVDRIEGKFASADEVAEAIASAIGEADLSGLGADGDSTYEITDCAVDHVRTGRSKARR